MRVGRPCHPETAEKVDRLVAFLGSPEAAKLTLVEIAVRTGCCFSTVSRHNRLINGPRKFGDSKRRPVSRVSDPEVHLSVANIYLAQYLRPCQCRNRVASCSTATLSTRPTYRTPFGLSSEN